MMAWQLGMINNFFGYLATPFAILALGIVIEACREEVQVHRGSRFIIKGIFPTWSAAMAFTVISFVSAGKDGVDLCFLGVCLAFIAAGFVARREEE